ncbi:hypothetical protein ACXR0O_17430 [Verrucomicrobiota bacterium sgz303538]
MAEGDDPWYEGPIDWGAIDGPAVCVRFEDFLRTGVLGRFQVGGSRRQVLRLLGPPYSATTTAPEITAPGYVGPKPKPVSWFRAEFWGYGDLVFFFERNRIMGMTIPLLGRGIVPLVRFDDLTPTYGLSPSEICEFLNARQISYQKVKPSSGGAGVLTSGDVFIEFWNNRVFTMWHPMSVYK